MAKDGKKDTRGRPEFQPTEKNRQQVEYLTGLMVPQAAIARFIEIDGKTLRKHFRAELDHGAERTIAKLKAVVFNEALRGSVRAATWLLDRLQAFPTPANGADARPAQVHIVVRGGLASVEQPPDIEGKPEPSDAGAT